MPFDKESIYDEQIAPLMTRIIEMFQGVPDRLYGRSAYDVGRGDAAHVIRSTFGIAEKEVRP